MKKYMKKIIKLFAYQIQWRRREQCRRWREHIGHAFDDNVANPELQEYKGTFTGIQAVALLGIHLNYRIYICCDGSNETG